MAKAKADLSVIIPILNEEKTIGEVLKRVLTRPEVAEVIVVDDGSSDKSFEITKKLDNSKIKILSHKINRGKGAAVITGLNSARSDYIVIQDGDLEYNPRDYPKLLEPLKSDRADFVIGTRWKSRHGYWYTLLANLIMTKLVNFLFRANFEDAYSGYKIGKKSVWEGLKLNSSGFEIEAEIVARLALIKARVVNVTISYKPRTYTEGKKIKLIDAVKGIVKLIQIRFTS